MFCPRVPENHSLRFMANDNFCGFGEKAEATAIIIKEKGELFFPSQKITP